LLIIKGYYLREKYDGDTYTLATVTSFLKELVYGLPDYVRKIGVFTDQVKQKLVPNY